MKKYINLILVIGFLIAGHFLMGSNLIVNSHKAVILQIGIYIIAALSLNVIIGFLGEFSLGHAGFMAIGAYTAAILAKNNCNFLIAIFIAAVFSGLLGILVGCFASKFKSDYLAVITLGISEIIRIWLINFESLTGGAKGLKSIPKYSNFLLIYVFVVATFLFLKLFLNSRHGRAVISIREDEIAARSVRVNVNYYKILSFCIAGFFAGISGALWAGSQGILTPNEFGFMKSVEILVMVIFSGMGSMIGVIISAASLTSLPLILQIFMKNFNNYRMIIYALLLIFIMILRSSKVKRRLGKWKESH